MKDVIEKNSKNTVQNFQHHDVQKIEVRRELNQWGRLAIVGVYSLAIFLLGHKIALRTVDHQVSGMTTEQIEKVNSLISKLESGADSKGASGNFTTAEKIFREHVKKINQETLNSINANKQEIANMNKNISKYMLANEINKGRFPSSLAPSTDDTIAFSAKESTILRYEQELLTDQLVQAQKDIRDEFLKSHDLTVASHKAMWDKLEMKQKKDLYRLRQNHIEQRIKFKKQGFRVVSQNEF